MSRNGKLNFSHTLIQLYVRAMLMYKLQFQQRNLSLLIQVAFPPLLQLRENVSKRKSNPISLIKSLPTAREVRKWQHAMTQIWKRNWDRASKVTAPIRITGWHTWERFWSGGYGQLHPAQVTRALLGIGQQDAQAYNTCWPGGGLGPRLSERSVRSNTDIAFCRVSERSGHHHEGALGWGHRASLPSTRPSAVLHGWLWWLDINS